MHLTFQYYSLPLQYIYLPVLDHILLQMHLGQSDCVRIIYPGQVFILENTSAL